MSMSRMFPVKKKKISLADNDACIVMGKKTGYLVNVRL